MHKKLRKLIDDYDMRDARIQHEQIDLVLSDWIPNVLGEEYIDIFEKPKYITDLAKYRRPGVSFYIKDCFYLKILFVSPDHNNTDILFEFFYDPNSYIGKLSSNFSGMKFTKENFVDQLRVYERSIQMLDKYNRLTKTSDESVDSSLNIRLNKLKIGDEIKSADFVSKNDDTKLIKYCPSVWKKFINLFLIPEIVSEKTKDVYYKFDSVVQ